MSKVIRISVLAMFTTVLLGNAFACNTAEGVGQDVQKAGDKLEDAADRNK